MKRIWMLLSVVWVFLPAFAQKKAPKWAEKAKKAVVTITTYGKDGNKIGSGNGFFVSETGEAVSAYELFKGAERATVTDAEGKELPVKSILGADELYDAVKFNVAADRKVPFLPLAAGPVDSGAPVFLLKYTTGKETTVRPGSVVEVSNLKEAYKYYKIALEIGTGEENLPLLTANGEVFALLQPDATGKKDICYGLSALYANKLSFSSTDFLTSAYRHIGIRKGWPKESDQAAIALYLLTGTQDVKTQLETINDFIGTFPNIPEGYLSRANLYAYSRNDLAASPEEQKDLLKKALADAETAGNYSTEKGDRWFNQAKLIYGMVMADSTIEDPEWTENVAFELLEKAIAQADKPSYHQLKGDIYFNRHAYKEAFDEYTIVNNSEFASSVSLYMAAKAKEQIPGFNIGDVVALLDRAIEKCGTGGISPEAASYVLERIDWRLRLAQYTEAIADYNLYYVLVGGQVSPDYYYLREQAKFRAGDLEGALADIRSAIQADPKNAGFHAEEASVFMRMQKYTEALACLEQAIQLSPDFAACHRLRGVCFVRLEKKAEACEALKKAKTLNDPLADKLLKEHCK